MSGILSTKNRVLFFFIFLSIFIRITLSFLPSFEIDESAYRYFSARLINLGFDKFYTTNGFNLNSLGFFYPLWLIGLFKTIFLPHIDFFSKNYDVFLKIPAILTDILSGFTIYYIVKKKWGERFGILGYLLYVLNPVVIFNSSIWGQYDSISTFFLLLSLLVILHKKAFLMSSLLAIALSLKPQAIFFAPIAIILLIRNTKPITWFLSFGVFLLVTLIIYLPFFPKNPFYGIYIVNSNLAGTYTCTSCFAFNFWGIFGNWKNDLDIVLGLPKVYWGILLSAIFYFTFFLTKNIKARFQTPYIFLSTAILIMSAYIFLTRMHDRYLFATFSFLLLAALLLRSKIIMFFYFLISLLHFLDLYYVYIYYNVIYNHVPNILFNQTLYTFIDKNFQNLSLLMTFSFFCFTFLFIRNFNYENK